MCAGMPVRICMTGCIDARQPKLLMQVDLSGHMPLLCVHCSDRYDAVGRPKDVKCMMEAGEHKR